MFRIVPIVLVSIASYDREALIEMLNKAMAKPTR